MFDFNHLMAGGLVLGFVAAFWAKIKAMTARIVSLFWVTVYTEDYAAIAVTCYFWKHFRRSPYGSRRYAGFDEFVRPIGRTQTIGYEGTSKDPLVFWRGWKFLVVRYELPPTNTHTVNGMQLKVSFVRGFFDAETMLIQALDEFNQLRHSGAGMGRFVVNRCVGDLRRNRSMHAVKDNSPTVSESSATSIAIVQPDRRLLKWKLEDLGAPKDSGDPLETMALTSEMRDLVKAGQQWLDSEKWYKDRKIPWRMGWLLYGPPGTGKSSLVRAIAQKFDLPIFMIDLATYENSALVELWKRLMTSAPCVVLIEDIDTVFNGRENVASGEQQDGLTFDCLLNCISGVGDASGLLTVITTNHIERLDDALGRPDPNHEGFSTRPGRIDRALQLGDLTIEGRIHVAKRILVDYPHLIEGVVAQSDGYTGAQFEDLCCRTALDHYWADKKGEHEQRDSVDRDECHSPRPVCRLYN